MEIVTSPLSQQYLVDVHPPTTVDFFTSLVKILHVQYTPRHSFSPSDRECDDTWRIRIGFFREISNAQFPVGTEATSTQDAETLQLISTAIAA